jgi:general stress protein 26
MNAKLRKTILTLLDEHADMALGTIREDGFPQVTTVTYVHDGLAIYFCCAPDSQKAANIARNPKVSAAIDKPQEDWNAIQGVSLGGLASRVTDRKGISKIAELFRAKYAQNAEYVAENADEIAFFRIDPVVFSVLDYTKGFGHTELVTL